MTESDSGENRYLAVPCQQEHRNEYDADRQRGRNVGRPTSPAPSTMARYRGSSSPTCRSMFSMTTVAVVDQNADGEREPAQRHRVEGLAQEYSTNTAAMIDSGMEARMISVSRQLPRNSRIISAVSAGRHQAAHDDAVQGGLDEDRLIEDGVRVTPAGSRLRSSGRTLLAPSITASVELPPLLRTTIRTPGEPFRVTALVCTW